MAQEYQLIDPFVSLPEPPQGEHRQLDPNIARWFRHSKALLEGATSCREELGHYCSAKDHPTQIQNELTELPSSCFPKRHSRPPLISECSTTE